jgi:phosphoglycerate dehydrogenase-like enzyme
MSSQPLVYIAINAQLFEEIELGKHLPAIEAMAQVERWEGPGNPPLEAVLEAIQRAEVLVTGWGTPALAQVLLNWTPGASPLRLLAHTAGSIHHLVKKETVARGLLVCHANESLAEAVAEFTLGAIIAMRRQMFLCSKRYSNNLPAPSYQQMNELPGSVIGIIGASAIGRRVMELLQPWRVNLLLYDPYATPATAAAYGTEQVSDLLTLFQRSDIISLHAPITPETIGMLHREHFAAMKDGALCINTARGRLVNHADLLEELQKGRIYAMLDVSDPNEPLPPDSPFFALDNCTLVPHQAGNSIQARQRQGAFIANDILNYLTGRPLRFPVPGAKMDTMA